MRTRRLVFWFSVAMLMGSLIIYGKCQAHPIYDERGHIVAEKEEPSLKGVVISGHLEYPSECGEYPDIIPILRECLEFIDDSSVIYNDPSDRDNYLTESTLAIYQLRSAQTDADDAAQAAQEQADRMQERAERYRRETELHKRIVEMINKLEPKEKKK